jgi:hypothetical protein
VYQLQVLFTEDALHVRSRERDRLGPPLVSSWIGHRQLRTSGLRDRPVQKDGPYQAHGGNNRKSGAHLTHLFFGR